MPYNKLLTNLACSNRTGEYWPSVVFVRTSLRSVRTATTSGQYSPVRPLRSVSKRLIIYVVHILYANFPQTFNKFSNSCYEVSSLISQSCAHSHEENVNEGGDCVNFKGIIGFVCFCIPVDILKFQNVLICNC